MKRFDYEDYPITGEVRCDCYDEDGRIRRAEWSYYVYRVFALANSSHTICYCDSVDEAMRIVRALEAAEPPARIGGVR